MADIVSYIKMALVVVFTFLLYAFITHALNEATCASLDRGVTPVIGKGLVKFLSLCWW